MALVFLDVDGTLLNHRTKKISSKNLEAIKLLKKNNHQVVICTGRVPRVLKDLTEKTTVENFVCANGKVVIFNGEIIFKEYIPSDLVEEVVEYCKKEELDISIANETDYVVIDDSFGKMKPFLDVFNITGVLVDPEYHKTHNVLQLNICDNSKVEKLRERFPMLEFIYSNQYGLDVNLKTGLKELGAEKLMEYLNVNEDEVYVFGDGLNDVGMMKLVKHSVAMGNAFDECKKYSSFVTLSIDFDGVYWGLKYFDLI